MRTVLIKKKKHTLGEGRFLKSHSGEYIYYTDAEIEQLRAERRIAPNQAEVLEKGKTARHSTLYVQYGHSPAAWVKSFLKRCEITIPEAARVLGVNVRTMQRWTTTGSGVSIPAHLVDVLDGWPNWRDQGGTPEAYRELLRAEGHPSSKVKRDNFTQFF